MNWLTSRIPVVSDEEYKKIAAEAAYRNKFAFTVLLKLGERLSGRGMYVRQCHEPSGNLCLDIVSHDNDDTMVIHVSAEYEYDEWAHPEEVVMDMLAQLNGVEEMK